MLRLFSVAVIVLLLFSACGSGDATNNSDSVQTSDSAAQSAVVQPDYKKVHGGIMALLPVLQIPAWINVDSVAEYNLSVNHADVAVLFPAGFGVPEEVNVYAFTKHQIDESTHAIWYKMQVQGSENKDIWVVLYDTNGPLAAHCAATKGVGYQVARIDSVNHIREVFMEQANDMSHGVTKKNIRIENGKFVTVDESNATGDGSASVEQYFK